MGGDLEGVADINVVCECEIKIPSRKKLRAD
jgi:hypothetical protein